MVATEKLARNGILRSVSFPLPVDGDSEIGPWPLTDIGSVGSARGKGNRVGSPGAGGGEGKAGPGDGRRAAGRVGRVAAGGSAGGLQPPVYGCQSGYQDAAEDLGDREYGEDQ